MPMHSTGGLPEKQLKKEKGAAFCPPAPLLVTSQAIGRGTTSEVISL